MAPRSALYAVLLVAAIGCAVNGVAAQTPTQTPFLRYISATKYRAGSNVALIASQEYGNLKRCMATFLGAVTGIANVTFIPKANSADYVKIIDFRNATGYSRYKVCDDAFINKTIISAQVVGKARSLTQVTTATSRIVTAYPLPAFAHIGLSNVSDVTRILPLRVNLTSQFAGSAVLDSTPGVWNPALYPVGFVAPSDRVNHANIIIVNTPNALLSYYYFKNGNNGTVGPLPVYSAIKALQLPGGQDSEFRLTRVV